MCDLIILLLFIFGKIEENIRYCTATPPPHRPLPQIKHMNVIQ